MAIYRIYPSKDASIYSESPTENTGTDSILEVGSTYSGDSIRTLIAFDQEEVDDVIANIIANTNYTASVNIYSADATSIPRNVELEVLPLVEDWVEGNGHKGDSPVDTTGVSWTNSNAVNAWDLNLGTNSYPTSESIGGGVWTTTVDTNYPAGTFVSSSVTQSITGSYQHTYKGSTDLVSDVTNFVRAAYHGEIENKGLLVKLKDNEFESGSVVNIKYFSSNTNTVFYPFLEFKWDNTNHTGSLATLDDSAVNIKIQNVRKEYLDEGKVRFRVHAAPKYPNRVFQTTSLYKQNYKLPTNAQWAIKDVATGENIVNFDSIGTALSSDDRGSYFDVWMDILYPERYYQLLIQAEIDGTTVIVDSTEPFKVISNG